MRALTACGTECGVVYRTTGPMRASEVVCLFELLEIVAEAAIDDLRSLFISVSDSAMDLSWSAPPICRRSPPGCNGAAEDGLWLVRRRIRGQEDA